MDTTTQALKAAIKAGNTQEIDNQLDKMESIIHQANLYGRVLDAMSDGWWSWNAQTNETYQNPTWFQMLGYDPAHYRPSLEMWLSLLHPDDRDYALAEQDRLSRRQDSWQMIFRMKAQDGCYHWILSSGSVIKRAADGSPLELAGTHRDMTYEQENRVSFSKEKEGIPMLQVALAVNPSAIKIYDYLRKKIVYSARLNEMVFGKDLPNHIGLAHNQIIDQLHPDDRVILLAHEQRMLTAADGEVFECYFRVKNIEGTYIWLWLRDTVFQRNDQGEPTQLLGTLTDITHFQTLESKLKKALATIEELARVNSHELRAPVANLLGLVDLMRDQIHFSKPAAELLAYMLQTIEQLDRVIYQNMGHIEQIRKDL